MRRTTICRSNRAALPALVAGLLAGVVAPSLAAQDTTQARADRVRAARGTSPAPPPAAAVSEGQLPATHTVVAGETLWSIAQLYFSDPLLWPEVYRLNTSVIEDPHWIYPGELLNIGSVVAVAQAPAETTAVVPQPTGADTVRAQAPADTVTALAPDTTTVPDTTQTVVEAPPPAPTEAYQTIFERRRTPGQAVQDVLRAYSNPLYRPLRRGEFYAAGFLTENERLPWGRVLGNTAPPAIPRLTERSTASRSSSSIGVVPKGSRPATCSRSSALPRVCRGRHPKRCVWCSRSCTPGSIRPPGWCSRSVIPTFAPECRSVSSGRCLPDLRPVPFGAGVTRPWSWYLISGRWGCTVWPRRSRWHRSLDCGPRRAP